MNTPRAHSFSCAAFCLRSLLLFLVATLTAHAAIDLNSDGLPDLWAMRYDAGSLTPTADTDGDGLTNAEEASAGTDPRSANSVIQVTSMSMDQAGLHLGFPSVSGKRYQLQSSLTLTTPDWQAVGAVMVGTNEDVTTTTVTSGEAKFYRVLVLDVDSDNDGVNDYEEILAGFNPNSSYSAGLSAQDDLTALTQALTAMNVVSVIASDARAVEPAPGTPSLDTGKIIITRRGNINALTVSFTVGGGATSGSDFAPLGGSVLLPMGVNSATVTVQAIEDAVVESTEAVIVLITGAGGYALGSPAVATVLISDHVAANGNGVRAEYWNRTLATTNDVEFPTGAPVLARIEPQINNTWPTGVSPGAGVNHDHFVSRYSAEVLPEFSQIYTFFANVNTGGRLWVNGQLLVNVWGTASVSGESSGTIALEAGRRYALVLEQMERTSDAAAILSWQSANRTKEVIPQSRLFANVPPQISSATEVMLLKNSGAFAYQIIASGNPTSFSAANLPSGWTFNASTGIISGLPSEAGSWEIALTATNAFGSGSAILSLQVIETGGGITRDLWTSVAGGLVSDIPVGTAPTSSALVSSLEGPQDSGDDYGARLRGYLTAPVTGVYKFWITADDAAELWISNDQEEVNAFKRAQVTAPTGFREWSNVGSGKSALLFLTAGRRYFVEVRHKESSGADHVSVGWLLPGQGGLDPANVLAASEVVPGYALSPYVPASASTAGSTLFTTSLTAQGGAVTSGYGTSSLQLSADETTAILSFTYSNLTTPVSNQHLHSDGLPLSSNIVFDIDDAVPQADGTYIWQIVPVSGRTAAQIVQDIKSGLLYLNIHTPMYPAGEIKGYFRLQAGSQTFTPPAAAPGWTTDHTNRNAASRFLIQTTFGPNPAEIAAVQQQGYSAWIDNQFNLGLTPLYPYVFANRSQTDDGSPTYPGTLAFNSWWRTSVTAQDQLRQRVAFALSEILVVSEAGPLDDRADTVTSYYDLLLAHAFGNFREMLEAVTLHPAMGRYLDMLNNDKPILATGRIPNENYAREILQLFSVGLNRMWPDGSLVLTARGEPIPTYDQDAIIGFAHVFTGWGYNYAGPYRTSFPGTGSTGVTAPWTAPMREVPLRHFTGQKRLLNNEVLPGLPAVGVQPLDPFAPNHSAAQYNDPAYQALAAQELEAAHNQIFNHPNTGPFICRQLIQRLVTSTPSRGYLYRVVQAFNNNGGGVRGDMKAVIRAILLDYEARSPQLLGQQGFGKLREPVSRVTAVARAFPAPAPVTGSYGQGQNGDPLNLIRVTTTAPHLYANGNGAFLDFSGSTPSDPDDAPYGVSNVTSTSFTVRPLTSEIGTYSQTDGVITIIGTDHTYVAGNSTYIDFTSGAPSSPADGTYTVLTRIDDNNFTVRSLSAFSSTYSQSANVITFSTAAPHSLTVGSSVAIDFTSGAPDAPPDAVFTVVSVSGDALQFSVTAADAVTRTGNASATPGSDAVARTGNATTTKATYALARTGNVAVNYGDWGMDTTNTDLNQTPLQSPTVFNFFLPDYQYPGPLSQAGLVTPEFEIVSDTSVIRQANFLFNGIWNGDVAGGVNTLNQPGLSSFKSGGRDIFFDLRPFMGTTAGPGGLPWVHNNNLSAFIDELNTRLMGGQLSSSARTIIRTYTQSLPYTTPSTTQLRDRVRAVVHLIVTSPDFTTQK